MITFKVLGAKRYGDIGNALFQYALLRLVAEQRSLEYGTFQWGGRWWFNAVANDCYAGLTKYIFQDVRGYRPNSHLYQPEVWDIEDETDLQGFFQSHRYYSPHRQKIKDWYRLVPRYEQRVDDILRKWPASSQRIGLQYRFADEYAQTFPILSHEYYKEALQEIQNRWGEAPDTYYVVSADLPYEQLGIDYLPEDRVCFIRTDPAVVMFAMTYCDAFVMSNSSFSWWTAFLNKAYDPLILCPQNYLGIDFCYPHEIYPSNWIQIPVNSYRSMGGWYREWKKRG